VRAVRRGDEREFGENRARLKMKRNGLSIALWVTQVLLALSREA
jgi:hypothetical protein